MCVLGAVRGENINKLICGLKSIKLRQWKLIKINHECKRNLRLWWWFSINQRSTFTFPSINLRFMSRKVDDFSALSANLLPILVPVKVIKYWSLQHQLRFWNFLRLRKTFNLETSATFFHINIEKKTRKNALISAGGRYNTETTLNAAVLCNECLK